VLPSFFIIFTISALGVFDRDFARREKKNGSSPASLIVEALLCFTRITNPFNLHGRELFKLPLLPTRFGVNSSAGNGLAKDAAKEKCPEESLASENKRAKVMPCLFGVNNRVETFRTRASKRICARESIADQKLVANIHLAYFFLTGDNRYKINTMK